jgi:phage tail sheath protein FI
MPVVPPHNYPGVFVQEVPGGVHTIMGVSTSITAFVGSALRGPVNEPTTVTSYAEFQRTFGGSAPQCGLYDAVGDFFLNGGSAAVIVRLFPKPASGAVPIIPSISDTPSTAAVTSTTNAVLTVSGLTLMARDPGSWGSKLTAEIAATKVKDDPNNPDAVKAHYGVDSAAQLFNLTITDTGTGTVEQFRNVTLQKDSPQRVDRVLAIGSQLVYVGAFPADSTNAPAAAKASAVTVQDGGNLASTDFVGGANDTFEADKVGLYALEKCDLFNLLCIPPYLADYADVDADVISQAAVYCENRRAMLLIDPPASWTNVSGVVKGLQNPADRASGGPGTSSKNAAVYFPRIKRPGSAQLVVPGAAIAGVMARTDAQRGVWKAPAGMDAVLNGVSTLSMPMPNGDIGQLNPLGVNCLRIMPNVGPVVWGARTLQGDDDLASEWKYIPVRRTALFIEESLIRGTQWAVFEPNDEPLWSQLRLNIGAFMHGLFVQGAFQGQKPKDAYFVQCDSTTTTQNDINQGIVNIWVGFAPLKPAEFVILYIQQMAGQIAV